MGLASLYSKQIRHNLNCFPVWEPGEEIGPGDVGILKEGVFQRETSLRKIFPDLAFKVVPNDNPHPSHFYSKDCQVADVTIDAAAQPHAKAMLRITFKKEGGVVFDASDCKALYIEDIYSVCKYLAENRSKWPPGMVLVSHIEKSPRFAVMISETKDAQVELSGEVAPLKEIRIADASVTVSSFRGLGYRRTGKGPVAARLYGFKWWRVRPRLLSADDRITEDADFAEISARDPSFD